mgnify:CR=1|tara:strand:- start:62 stop:295 length:234 start_codon:yes stop_codon:yes gene_type:complete
MNKHNDSTCNECGVYVPMHRYEKAKLCESCRADKRSGNAELRNIFKELQRKASKEKEDWGSQNIKTKDDAMLRHHRF